MNILLSFTHDYVEIIEENQLGSLFVLDPTTEFDYMDKNFL